MKSFSLAKALTLGCLVCLALPIACGDDETTPSKPNGGSDAGGEAGSGANVGGGVSEGGAAGAATALPPGISDMSRTIECGADMCKSVGVGPVFIDPCCSSDACGLDTGFLALVGAAFTEKCQAKDQPGDLDEMCPTSDASTIPFEVSPGNTIMVPIEGFAGCCRENGKCGVAVNDVVAPMLGGKIATLGLGCVDAAPFFPGTTPAACGAGVGGAGGAGGDTGGAANAAGASTGGAGGAGGAQ